MKTRRTVSQFVIVGFLVSAASLVRAQAGRVFGPTAETIAIYEFNEFTEIPDGSPITTGVVVPDLSGNGLAATVEDSAGGDFILNPGAGEFPGNREVQRLGFTSSAPRIAVNDDGNAFEMEATDDFSIESFVNREIETDAANWGILAGTWHSRNLLTDTQVPEDAGAWYGYGLIRNGNGSGAGQWQWVTSPVVDGIPRIGFAQDPEQHVQPPFDIPLGRHYVVLSVDRVNMLATAYLDGVQVSSRTIPPEWTFTTPTGYEHARFLMFSGEDDPTRGAYRGSPAGTHLDAVRVQRKALTIDEVLEIWDNIQLGITSPPTASACQAIVSASNTNVLTGQCVSLSGAASSPGPGQTITRYEWRIGPGAFEEGPSTREVSFPTPGTVEVALRITDSGACTNTSLVRITAQRAPVRSIVTASLGGKVQAGSFLMIPKDSILTLDGTASTSVVPASALVCPLVDLNPLPVPAISEYRWDLDGSILSTEDTRPVFDTVPFATLEEKRITLTAVNAEATLARSTVTVNVADAGGNSTLFHNTDDTIVHFEFNDFPALNDGDALPVAEFVEDLSGNGLDAVVEGNEGGDLTINSGAPVYDVPAGSNREVQRTLFSGQLPRLAINEDNEAFEFDPTEDFTVELFVNRETVDGGANWGILAGTWHSRNLLDDGLGDPDNNGAWHGFGLIRNDKVSNPPNEWSWVLSPVVSGVPRIGFNQQPEQHLNPFFNIPAGRHYVVLTVDRIDEFTPGTATGYVDGVQVTSRDVPADWSFTTPDGYDHARFLMYAGEDDPTTGTYRGSPAGTHLDAVRVQSVALTAENVDTNWKDILAGRGANPGSTPVEQFRRGDTDGSKSVNITDMIRILNFLFAAGPRPDCQDAADVDDSGGLNITDGIYGLNFLFSAGRPIPAPGTVNCGPDPTPADTLPACVYNC